MQAVSANIFFLVLLGMIGMLLLVVSFILVNSRGQNKMLRQRQDMQQAELTHQKELMQVVIESQEVERKRIGQDLHDDVGTALSSLRMTIEMLEPVQNNAESHKFIGMSKDIIDKVIKDVRHISHNLSPPVLSYYGLAAAIEEKCLFINNAGQLEVVLVNDAQEMLEKLEQPVALAFYRVLEELVNNTIKHAGATRATINFQGTGNGLVINYTDNGKGLKPGIQKKGMGLQNIESRLTVVNATYAIDDTAKGFHITITYPPAKAA